MNLAHVVIVCDPARVVVSPFNNVRKFRRRLSELIYILTLKFAFNEINRNRKIISLIKRSEYNNKNLISSQFNRNQARKSIS
jgi:hypothetical protein